MATDKFFSLLQEITKAFKEKQREEKAATEADKHQLYTACLQLFQKKRFAKQKN